MAEALLLKEPQHLTAAQPVTYYPSIFKCINQAKRDREEPIPKNLQQPTVQIIVRLELPLGFIYSLWSALFVVLFA